MTNTGRQTPPGATLAPRLAPAIIPMVQTILLTLGLAMILAACSENPANRFQGYVEGEFVNIASPLGGTLDALSVVRGQQVRQGDPLFVLEHEYEQASVDDARHGLQRAQDSLADQETGQRPSEIAAIKARLRQARAAATLARIEYDRRVKLIREQTISQEELDQAKNDFDQTTHRVREINAELETARLGARSGQVLVAEAEVRQAQAALDQALWNLGQKTRVAPADGLIFDTFFRVGEWVATGQPLVSLLPPENIEIRFFVPEAVVGSLAPAQEVQVTFDGAPQPVAATITFISPSAEYTPPVIYSSQSRAKLVFMIRARPALADAPSLHPGQPVDVTIPALPR
ncbi:MULTISPECIES: HlyD family secretion protein [Pseudodesulfovibrio]|nr:MULTISPECIES: HlyD family efflux transporter periplasmic adaptor subunit [Pseudodesulfovibrio]MCG2732334.1 HlyD family efflux transporter periplasmic adaptor subunit [Pseudodesulfovibrio aespoeensis]